MASVAATVSVDSTYRIWLDKGRPIRNNTMSLDDSGGQVCSTFYPIYETNFTHMHVLSTEAGW